MADEVKETVETTEAAPAAEKTEKKKVNIDTAKIKGQAVGVLSKLKALFVEKPATARIIIVAALVVQVLLAASAGTLNLIISAVIAAVVGYGVWVSVGVEKKDAPADETPAE